MSYRDDHDAALRRAEALERDNARLRADLAERAAAPDRTPAARDADADADADARLAALERDNAALREQLARARGPGVLRRFGAWLAALRLPEPRGDGGFARGALRAWRLYVPVTVGLAVQAAGFGRGAGWVLAAFAAGTPVLAAVLLAVAWLLGRRHGVVGGLTAGIALAITTTAALFAQIYVAHGEAIPVIDLFRSTTVGGVVATVLLLITRGVPPRDLLGPQLLVLLVLAIPSPVFGWLFWAFPVWGARLVDPDFKRG
ncbi:MAG: hypothetical protein H6709_20550 [Kofleriaceae bacterium]|nr:hypothetical protein [Kofleriaceae bacterium]